MRAGCGLRASGFGLIVTVALVGCLGGEHRDARDTYNDGVTALGSGDLDGAEKLLIEARSSAGVDPELRYRAAFDLGAAYAAQAEKLRAGQDEDLDKALDLEQNAVSWFSDALRQHPGDADATGEPRDRARRARSRSATTCASPPTSSTRGSTPSSPTSAACSTRRGWRGCRSSRPAAPTRSRSKPHSVTSPTASAASSPSPA